MLSGLGLVFVRSAQERNESNVDEEAVLSSHFERYLSYRLDEGLRFDIAYRTADFRDDDVGIGLLAYSVDELLDLVGDVRNDLHCGAEILSPSLAVQNVPVDAARCEVRILVKVFVDEPLVVTEIEVCLSAVFGDVDFAVLIRTHGSGVNIDIRVQLLRRDLESARLEKPSQACRRNTLA